MRPQASISTIAISLGILTALIAVSPAQAQFWPASTRRAPGERTIKAVSQPIASTTAAGRAVPQVGAQPNSMDAAWRDFAATRATLAADSRSSAGMSFEPMAISAAQSKAGFVDPEKLRGLDLARPDPTTSYYPALRSGRGHVCTPTRASVLAQNPPRPVVREELPRPQVLHSWGNAVVIPTTPTVSLRRGRK